MIRQLQLPQAFPDLVVRASAGTGKTFQLSHRFLALLQGGARCDQILATTFTRKAAGEILDRVIGRLAEAAEDEAKRRDLSRFIGWGPLRREACLSMLEDMLRSLHRLRVSTLDSFFAQIARSFSLELGFPSGWQIVEDLHDARLRSQAIDAVLTSGDHAKLRTLVTLLTKGEASRGIASLIRETVNGLYDLFQDAPEEAWHQVPRFKPLDEAELAAALETLRTAAVPQGSLAAARDEDCRRAVDGDWGNFLAKGLAAKVADDSLRYRGRTIPEPIADLYRQLIQHAKAELVGRLALQTEASYELLKLFHVEYHRLKNAHRVLRFEDVTRRLANLRGLDGDRGLAFRLDARIEHLLLDEFQDTSPPQWRVLRPLAERLVRRAGSQHTSFFCVGDVKQAIYGWRGGVAEIFDAISQQLPGLQQDTLSKSYRSSQPVIDTVNRVFARLGEHPRLGRTERAVRQFCQRFTPHATAKTELPGYVELVAASQAGPGETQPDVTNRSAAAKIADLVRQAPGASVGVLVRKNETVARIIYELRRLHVAASEEGGNPLTDSAAVTVVLSLLSLADHPGDRVARFHVARSPLGPLAGLADYSDDALARHVAQQVRSSLLREGYGPTILAWAERLAGHCNRRELNRLEQLVEMAYAYEANATLRTDDFVAYIRSKRVADPSPVAVRVMTIHQAKGLEFDIVVLPELQADLAGQNELVVVDRPDVTGPVARVCRYASEAVRELLPASFRRMFAEAIDRDVTESLCVLYVALTRAIHALHIIIPPSAPNERSVRCNLAGLLRVALKDTGRVEPEAVLYQQGDPHWFQRRTAAPTKRLAASRARPVPPIRVQLAPLAGPRRRGLERARPSGLEGGSSVSLHHLFTAERAGAFARGQLIHAWFEQIQWLDDGRPDEALLRRVAQETLRAVGAMDLDVTAELARFNTLLASRTLVELLCRERYLHLDRLGLSAATVRELSVANVLPTVHNERGFAIRQGGRLLTGFIDRLVLLHDGDRLAAAEIIDFKTDKLEPGNAEQLAEKTAFYAPQIQAYREAVEDLTALPAERIAATLAFVQTGVVRSV